VEDLESTNGTFVNERRVTRHSLRHGDVVLVGKHRLVFDQMAAGQPVEPNEARPVMSNLGDTVFLDTQQHKELLARLTATKGGASPTANVAEAPSKVGVLRVLAGRADQSEYDLEAQTSLIGKADTSLVRLTGWFKPAVAVAITRSSHGYMATRLDGNTMINSQPLTDRSNLKEGDILRVNGLTLEFRLKDRSFDNSRRA
jgi:hypothetical protein